MGSSYYRQNKRHSFFGKSNYVNYGRFCTYKSVLSNDEIVLRTNNITCIKIDEHTMSDVLIVYNNMYVFLKPWQILKAKYRDENGNYKSTNLVKLNRNYFRAYRSKENFPNINFKVPDDFNSLMEHAKLQGLHKLKVETL